MRLLAWNIRQGGGSRLPRIAEAMKRHDADIVILSEYRGGPSAHRLCAALHVLGYRHATTVVPPPSRNGVLVAARCPFREHGAVNMRLPEPYRMVSVEFAMFRLVGIYMPNLLAKLPYWEALIAALSSESADRALAIGDFNTCRASQPSG
jgi:exonuclease III